jgi:hypothetical protein
MRIEKLQRAARFAQREHLAVIVETDHHEHRGNVVGEVGQSRLHLMSPLTGLARISWMEIRWIGFVYNDPEQSSQQEGNKSE